MHGLDFMKFFPLEALIEHPEACLFHFFKRGVVIVKDSNESEWLYIVKSVCLVDINDAINIVYEYVVISYELNI